jgi:hypothetical protein
MIRSKAADQRLVAPEVLPGKAVEPPHRVVARAAGVPLSMFLDSCEAKVADTDPARGPPH